MSVVDTSKPVSTLLNLRKKVQDRPGLQDSFRPVTYLNMIRGACKKLPLDWLRRQVRPKVVGAVSVIAIICGAVIGWYSGYVSQAIVVQVSFPSNPSPSDSWSCAVHLNNEDSFRRMTGTGNGEATFPYVNNILATCTKLTSSIYSIGVSFKTLTGQTLNGVSYNPTIATIAWSRSAPNLLTTPTLSKTWTA